MMPRSAWIFCCLAAVTAPLAAQNANEDNAPPRFMPDQEQSARDLQARYANQLPAGQFVVIPVGTEGMPALWLEQRTAEPQGGALIVHDDGQHPAWPRIVQDLRQHLPTHGWSTLAITLPPRPAPPVPMRQYGVDEPIPASAAGNDEDLAFGPGVAARLQAGEAELGRRGLLNVVIVGVGAGARHAAEYLANERQGANDGLGLIIIGARPEDTAALAPSLGALAVPILDIYFAGEPAASAARERRASVIRAGNTELTQVREQSRSTAHRQGPQPLTRRAWGWLRNNRAGIERPLERVE